MDQYEKNTLQAACIQAAAILLAANPSTAAAPPGIAGRAGPDTAACAKFARDLFGKLTGESWD